MNKLFQYKIKLPHTPHARGAEETHVIDGEQGFVESYISKDEFGKLFGGYLSTRNIDESSGIVKFKGVWGKDKIRKFKQILLQRGAEFELCSIDCDTRSVRITSRHWLTEK